MNNEKAREYFSAYYEGSLDAGLARAFENKLGLDSGLKREFELFRLTMQELDSLREETVEIPFDLNERISAAVDRSIYEKKQSTQPGWTLWLRNLAFGGLAAAAIAGAYISLNSGSTNGPSMGGAIAGPSNTIEQIEYSKAANGIQMNYQPAARHTVTIKGGRSGDETFEVSQAGWLNILKNDQVGAAVFVVEVRNEVPPTSVIVPGTARSEGGAGQGSIVDFGKAIADRYGVPVIVRSMNAASEISWNLAGNDAHITSQANLQRLPYVVDTKNGILTISDN